MVSARNRPGRKRTKICSNPVGPKRLIDSDFSLQVSYTQIDIHVPGTLSPRLLSLDQIEVLLCSRCFFLSL